MKIGRRGFIIAGVGAAATGLASRAQAGGEVNPGKPVPKYMEAYEVSEYGRAPTQEDFDLLLKA